MVDKLTECKDIRNFNDLIGLDKVKVEIGEGGGRHFIVKGKSYSMNQIVHKLEEIGQGTGNVADLNLARKNVAFLNAMGTQKLKDASPHLQRLTAIRHFFGILGAKFKYGLNFDKDRFLKDYSKIAIRELLQKPLNLPDPKEQRLERRAKILGDLTDLTENQKELLLKIDTQLWGKYKGCVEGDAPLEDVVDAFRDQLGQTTRKDLAELLQDIQKKALKEQAEGSADTMDKVD